MVEEMVPGWELRTVGVESRLFGRARAFTDAYGHQRDKSLDATRSPVHRCLSRLVQYLQRPLIEPIASDSHDSLDSVSADGNDSRRERGVYTRYRDQSDSSMTRCSIRSVLRLM
ncbi:hypothetical protein WN48_03849 [Eufriesea mexicana]|uniref:Uncharacterized protein n=1 Tax=Eufriesea mexicana TaxID=516756 RepID=A0A310SCE1_9HYME|nr:hypothetical protein WN48_03849 [Eufriesea mexicana]